MVEHSHPSSSSSVRYTVERRSPLHDLLADRGAVFAGTCSWRYPLWFRRPSTPDRDAALRHEHHLVRHLVGVIDCSCLAHVLIAGPGALTVINWLSTSNLDTKIGKVTYTQWCGDDGRILVDAIVDRRGPDAFVVTVNDTLQQRTLHLLESALTDLCVDAVIVDQTSAWSTIVVAGPLAAHVLAPLVTVDLDEAAFATRTAVSTTIAGAPVTIMRVSYVGELSFELHIPTEYAWSVGSILLPRCEALGGGAVGLDAMYALGTEAGMLDYDYNLAEHFTPIEAGLGFTISWLKPGGFRGSDALARQAQLGSPTTRLAFATMTYSPSDSIMRRKHLIGGGVSRNGQRVGDVLSVDRCFEIEHDVAVVAVRSPGGVSDDWLHDGTWFVCSPVGDEVEALVSRARPYVSRRIFPSSTRHERRSG